MVYDILSDKCDIIFICEHWLRPCEVPIFSNDFAKQNYWSDLKSSIDPEQLLKGRPYGGIGFVCKKISNITYQSIVVDSNRISGLQLLCNSNVILTIYGVYQLTRLNYIVKP